MTPENPCPWAERLDCAVTVCDTQGVVVYQNVRSREVNGDVRGRSLIPCHNDRSQQIIHRLLSEGGKNVYTIQKRGVRKLIYQTVWHTGEEIPVSGVGPDRTAFSPTEQFRAATASADTHDVCAIRSGQANPVAGVEAAGPNAHTPSRGPIGGLVEFSFEIPEEMPHYIRG